MFLKDKKDQVKAAKYFHVYNVRKYNIISTVKLMRLFPENSCWMRLAILLGLPE